MKKSIFITLLIIITSLLFIGCSETVKDEPYTAFEGVDETQVMEVDDYVTIDGVLNETFWGELAHEITVEGDMVSQSGKPIDEEIYGERSMTVYSYIGDKAIYFAFDVRDKFMMFNPDRNQGGNTGVEIYLTSDEHHRMEVGCVSIRVSPTGNGNEVFLNTYVPKSTDDEWKKAPSRGKTVASVVVDGNMMTVQNRNPDMSENQGYTVELAVDWSLIASKKPEAIQFTSAFCQASGWEGGRLDWNLFPGTGYCTPASWYLMNNVGGFIEDKTEFFDVSVESELDEGMSIDGTLDEVLWQDAIPRTIVTNKTNADSEEITLSVYNKTTEKGVYIGLESNDNQVWYHEDLPANSSTGAELMIATNKVTRINPNTVIQYRFNVGGKNVRQRWYGDPYKELPYVECYFPLLSAGKTLGANINTANADGWVGEIFIPWRTFGLSEGDYLDGIAIMPCMYRGFAGGNRNYCAPSSQDVWGNGSKLVNPQERWFVFEDGKPYYKNREVKDLYLTRENLVGDKYSATIEVKLSDDIVTTAGYSELFPTVSSADIDLGSEDLGITATANGAGSFTALIPQSKIEQFKEGKEFSITANGEKMPFKIFYDGDYLVDGIFDESVYSSLKKFTDNQSNNGHTCSTEFTVSFARDAMFVFAKIADDGFTANSSSLNLGMELYMNYGDTLLRSNSRQVRFRSKDGNQVAFFIENTSSYPWDGMYESGEVVQAFHDNNDGTYNLEGKIPYSVLGLSEKPQWIEIIPVTKYHNGGTGVRTSFFNNGNTTALSTNRNYYLGFNESGYAHNKAVVKSFDGKERMNEVSILDTKEEVYTGTFTLSQLADGKLKITDATFNSIVTPLGEGEYSFSIPKSIFNASGRSDLMMRSSSYNGYISFKLVPVKQMIVTEKTMIYDFEAKGDNFVKTIKVLTENNAGLPNVTFGGKLASKITATDKQGEYLLTLTKAEAQALTTPETITATFNDLSKSFTVTYCSVASSVLETALYNSSSAISDVKKNFAIGTSSFTAGCNLSIPSTFTGDAMTLRDVFSTSSNRGGGTGFRISFKKQNGKYQVCVQNNGIFSNSAQWYDFGSNFEYVGKTIAFVVEVDRTSVTTFKINIYFNGNKIAVSASNGYTDTYTVSETFVPQSTTDTNIIFGYGGWDGNNDGNSAIKGSNGWTVSDITINKSLCASELSNELMSRQ